jgi:hypothetical protein
MACKFCANVMTCKIYIEIKIWDSLKTLDFEGGVLTRYDDQSKNKLLPRQSPGRMWVHDTKGTSLNPAC